MNIDHLVEQLKMRNGGYVYDSGYGKTCLTQTLFLKYVREYLDKLKADYKLNDDDLKIEHLESCAVTRTMSFELIIKNKELAERLVKEGKLKHLIIIDTDTNGKTTTRVGYTF